jgi:tetratricopeptide (TPR) repeat protein
MTIHSSSIRARILCVLLPLFLAPAIIRPVIASSPIQSVDPFYGKLFVDGETAYLARDYAGAIKTLEVAAFGLSSDKVRAAKAHIYLSLSYYSLKDAEKSRKAAERAVGLIGEGDPKSLNLADSALNAFLKLIDGFKIRPGSEDKLSEKPGVVWQQSAPEPERPVAPAKPAIDPSRVKELEARHRSVPDDFMVRYELAAAYTGQGLYKKALRIMEDLLRERPGDVKAIYHISRTNFFQGNYRKSIDGFHTVMSPASESQITKDMGLRATVYIALCLDKLDQKPSLASVLDQLTAGLPPAELKRILAEEGLTKQWASLEAGAK